MNPDGVAERLATYGIALGAAPAPAAAYAAVVADGDLLYVSGQTARTAGGLLHAGVVGRDLTLDEGVECARQCAINVLAQLQAAAGSLDHVKRVLHLGVYVASTSEFADHHLVADGASKLLNDVLGSAGGHTRTTVGVVGLPRSSPVEVDATVRVVSAHAGAQEPTA